MRKPILAILLIITAVLMTACNNKDSIKELEPYTYEKKTFDKDGWKDLEVDQEMTIDGVLEESLWTTSNAYTYSNSSNTNTLTIKSHFGDKGVYIGLEMEDSSVYVNNQRLFWKNDSVELYMNPLNLTSGPNSSFAQIRIDATGNTETWIGVHSDEGYEWSKYYLPLKAETVIDGTLNPEGDELSNGYTIELFIPYEALLLDEKPERISMLPAFVESNGMGDMHYAWNPPVGASHTSLGTYLNFGPNGYIEKQEGTLFGNYSDLLNYTGGFDLSDEGNKVTQTGVGDQFVYFKDVHSSTYMYSVDIKLNNVLNEDKFPKAGVILGDTGEKIVNFLFDPLPDLSSKTAVITTGNATGDRAWEWGAGIGMANSVDYNQSVKVTVIRDDVDFYILINDELLLKKSNILTGDSTPGLFTMNLNADYTNYTITEDRAAIDSKIETATRQEGDLFGDSEFGKISTPGFDLSNEVEDLEQTGQGDQWIYFKDVYSTRYMFSVDVILQNRLNNDPYPKVGVILGENESGIKTFLLDPLPSKDNYYGIFVPRDTGENWQWGAGSPLPYHTNYNQTVNIKVIRDQDDFYVLIDDVVVDVRHIADFGNSQPGLYTMNHEAVYSNYSVSEDDAAIDAKLIEAKAQFTGNETFENLESFQGPVGFDLSTDDLKQVLGQDKATYFKGIEGSHYMFTTTIKLEGVLNDDAFPKAGVIIGDDGTDMVTYFFDPLSDFTQKVSMVVHSNSKGEGWQWPGTSVDLDEAIDYTQGVEVTVIRQGNDYYVLVNGQGVYQGQDLLAADSKIGFLTMNMAATYSDNSVVLDVNAIQTAVDNFVINGDGGTVESDLFGDSPTGETTTGGYDLTNAETGTVTQANAGEQIIYFKNINSSKYMIEASFLMGESINDAYPKIGLLAAMNNSGRLAYLADTRMEKIYKDVMAVYQPKDGNWDWGHLSAFNGGINYDTTVHLKVIRDGENFYFFINDTYMFNRTVTGFTEASVAGLITIGQKATFTNYSATEDAAIIDAEINQIMINNTAFNWSGEGDIIVHAEDSLTFKEDSHNVRESDKVIYKDGVTLEGNFFIEYKVSNITVSQDIPDWMWPKFSLLLINDLGDQNVIAIGASDKQMRLETMIDGGWQNGIGFPAGTNLLNEHTIRVERIINSDNTSTLTIYFDGVNQTFDGGQNRTTVYTGSYTFGFTGDYAAGNIYGITHGVLSN